MLCAFIEAIFRLIPLLNSAIENTQDLGAYDWWKQQKIVSSSIPNNITITRGERWGSIPKWRLFARFVYTIQ